MATRNSCCLTHAWQGRSAPERRMHRVPWSAGPDASFTWPAACDMALSQPFVIMLLPAPGDTPGAGATPGAMSGERAWNGSGCRGHLHASRHACGWGCTTRLADAQAGQAAHGGQRHGLKSEPDTSKMRASISGQRVRSSKRARAAAFVVVAPMGPEHGVESQGCGEWQFLSHGRTAQTVLRNAEWSPAMYMTAGHSPACMS